MEKLENLARFARSHDCYARVTGGHVLVITRSGDCLATRSVVRFKNWMGY